MACWYENPCNYYANLLVMFLTLSRISSRADQLQLWSALEDVIPSIAASEQDYFQAPCDDHSAKSMFDFVVVGAGAAGCAVASRLSEVGAWSVLLLEAGPDETLFMDIPYFSGVQPETNWNYTSEPQRNGGCPGGPDAHCPYPRGRVMGGSTTVNLMLFIRGNRQDYDHWAAMGNEGWDYDSVLPYFKKMENVQIPSLRNSPYHGTHGNIMNSRPYETNLANMTLDAAKLLGIPEVDYNGAEQTGIAHTQSTTFNGRRWSSNRGYLFGLHRPNLYVRKRALVTKVIVVNGTAVGVEYIRNGTQHNAFATREVVLSAGSINSPQLLMLSGIGPREHLENIGIPVVKDLPVGRTLIDHAMFLGLVITFNTTFSPTRFETLRDPRVHIDYFTYHTGIFSSVRTSQILRFYEIGNDARRSSWANMEMFLYEQPSILTPTSAETFGFTEEFYNVFSTPLLNKSAIQAVILNLRPKSRGTLNLQDKNIYSQPVINPNFFSVEEDVKFVVEGVREAIDLLTSGPFAELGAQVYDTPVPACADLAFGSDEYWSCAVRWASATIYHPVATCRMGPAGDAAAVVSPSLKVWGIKKLRVVDASVMPEIPTAHTQVPTYMVAEKGADLIKCEHLGRLYCSAGRGM